MREMRSALASRIYKNGVKQSASGAVSPDLQWSIPMFRANFLCFASKIVEPSRYLLFPSLTNDTEEGSFYKGYCTPLSRNSALPIF